MRERTPSADDNPKRAPPAPLREAASADVTGSKTSSEPIEEHRLPQFSSATTASSSVDTRMVASTHHLDELSVSHPTSANGDRQQQQEKHGHGYRSAQTAQDKRSRLSNVINNLRKKVPDSRNGESPRKDEDDRNSVERNLETLEKYVMTVLNGVIKDEEDDDREMGRKKEEKAKEPEKLAEEQEDEDSKGPAANFEPSKPNESRTEAVVFSSKQPEAKEPCAEHRKLDSRELDSPRKEAKIGSESKKPTDGFEEEKEAIELEAVDEEPCKDKCSSRETRLEDDAVQETTRTDVQEEEKKENRSLGTIIMERLSDHQAEDKGNVETVKDDVREFVPENVELRNVCRDLLNDLLNGINQLIDENSQAKEETRTDGVSEESKDCRGQDVSTTSLHCSLPLDKVASVLQNCQTSELAGPQSPSSSSSSSSQGSKSPCKPTSPTVRHLCLYCDRKFLSISLRQRHTERVHQQGGGRRSERNSRRPSQNCQYCSDKCAESLEGLFQHMVGSHGDKYYACVQCSTRYLTREALAGHMSEFHADRSPQIQEKMKEPSPCKELGNQSPRDRQDPLSPKERRSDESDHEHRAESILLKPMVSMKDNFSNPGSPEFDSSFYSSVSCNIRENLLHHLDGKLQSSSSTSASATSSIVDSKPQLQQQTFYEHSPNQIQFPIDISLTAATPVYSKDYANEEYENNSEYAQKPSKRNRSHPRRVSFEKYNFPRKYDGKEQWTCSIKDLSKFDISTQLSLRKKQQLLKERITLSRLHQIPVPSHPETTDIARNDQQELKSVDETSIDVENEAGGQLTLYKATKSIECKVDKAVAVSPPITEFSSEFGSFMRLRKWNEKLSTETAKKQEVVYAELTGEWSRPRVYICGACATKHVTLKEMEDHKAISHPNVWCSHFEFSGDQRELYKHLFLPGRNVATAKAKAAILTEKVCTKCSKNCATLSELHRHMLECGGDQAWLLGLFGNGKKKCKWRPFGSRSRRRRQRGMKRNIQNSQTPRVNAPKEKQPAGPRVRPSDRESIQKMLANLPPKRATRKVLQDSQMRTQGRLRNVQTRTRRRMVGDNSTASRMSRNKAVLRNKLLKNAKSIQRHRCRIDNISAVIESVVRNYHPESSTSDDEGINEGHVADKETKEKSIDERPRDAEVMDERGNRPKVSRGPRVLGKKRNVKTKDGATKNLDQVKKTGNSKTKAKWTLKNPSESKVEGSSEPVRAPKGVKILPKNADREAEATGSDASPVDAKSPNLSTKNKSFAQTTPKRKRPVDPVASLNASIKAKSQLRTQDGKFAKNPNKDQSPGKPTENKSPVLVRQLSKEKVNETNPESSVTRSKLRTVSRNRNNEPAPKRTTRLSSDSDKMPTLEPAVQIPANTEDYTEATANDLPILSPVTPSSSPEKASRGKNWAGKGSGKKVNDDEETEGKGEAVDRDQKPTKGRRTKSDARKLENVAKGTVKEKWKRKSAPARILNLDEKKTATKKEDAVTKTLDTRNNTKAKVDKSDAEPINIENVPFEVKKLIGSDSKEDLLNKLALTSLTTTSKRCLRQPVSRIKVGQTKSKSRKDTELEKKADSGSMSDASTKKEKFEARRKSLRNTERKLERGRAVKEDKLEQANKICEAVNEVKATIRCRRSSSLSSDSKSTSSTGQVSTDNQIKTDTDSSVQNGDKRQTRGSLMNSNEDQNENSEVTQKKTTFGKRRGRVRSSIEASDKKNAQASETKTEETDQSSSNVPTGKTCPVDRTEGSCDDNNASLAGDDATKDESTKCPDVSKAKEAEKVNLNVNHLQAETGNSVDSGKENSLETTAPVQKVRVGRPRKSWGTRRERTSKRSLNNVIGILTEGKNIPAETQQSVVLTSQPTVDAVNPEETSDNDIQQSSDDSRSPNADKSDKSSEGSQIQVTEDPSVPVQNSEGESCQSEALDISGKDSALQDGSMKNQKGEISSKSSKELPPTDDIILDLSRRKQKGKGSFLEKIVSKIAKQKDALLEGEVGSLLDTAADELTSILDEVGPALSEVVESTVETKNCRTEGQKEVQGREQKIEKVSDDNTSSLDTNKGENREEERASELIKEGKKVEKDPDTKAATNIKQMEPQTTSEEECESEMQKTVTEDSDKDTKVSLKDVEDKDPDNTNAIEADNNDQNSNEKVSKSHKYSSKEGRRRSKGKKAPARSRIADLTSGSEDSEVEDEIELRNKSMIVKSVFGRVFGGEKTDKVKEMLNDWVSKSEDDSDLSTSEFRSASPTEAVAEEASEVKDEDKDTKRCSISSSVSSGAKKKSGRKPKEDASSEMNPVAENHTKSKNGSNIRRKCEQDSSTDGILVLPTSKSRHSKKIAEERISRSLFLGIEQKENNYGLRSQDRSDSMIKDSDYGLFSNDEDSSKMVSLVNSLEEDQKSIKGADPLSLENRNTKTCKETSSWNPFKEISADSNTKVTEDEPISPACEKMSSEDLESNQSSPEYAENTSLGVQKETSIRHPNIGEFSSTEPSSTSNEIQLSIVKSIPEESGEKKNRETVSEETKIKRKSKKRSLEGCSPKKSKRKSVEPVDDPEEDLIPDELDLADIMELIDKSKQVPSTKENCEDDSSTEEAIQCGKRKAISEDSDSKMAYNARIVVESTEIVKKLKVNSEDNLLINKQDEIEMQTNDPEDSVEPTAVTKAKDKVDDEEKGCSLSRITGKRKSCTESANRLPKSESPVRRSSKRRSVQEERAAELFNEDTLFRLESVEATKSETTSEVTRRRSSRMKSIAHLKDEDRSEEKTESDSIIDTENVEYSIEKCHSSTNEVLSVAEGRKVAEEEPSSENIETQEQNEEDSTENLTEPGSTEPENLLKSPNKEPKKKGRKKKNLSNVQAQVIDKTDQESPQSQTMDTESVAADQIPRRSLRTGRFNEELEEQNRNSNDLAKSQTPCLEQFKVPEVTEVLQHTKKRTSKRKSTTEEHLDVQNNSSFAEPEINSTKSSETNKIPTEKEERPRNVYQKEFLEGREHSSKNCLERSSSSGSIDLTHGRTRSNKRKQQSSEDLSGRQSVGRRAESVDNLSETSCTSESSYFRKKRFSKRKKEYQEPEDVQTDTSATDSESVDTERTSDRRQSLRRKAKENISFEDSAFDLVDYFDIPMDIQDCMLPEDTVENSVSQEPAPESSVAAKNDVSRQASEENNSNEDEAMESSKKSAVENEEESKEKAEGKQDDFQTPKKRAAGNFVVVHKKTGEILIVEKRKKLTKEAARFFCDVCATSFTRKSSLKKHNQSQSHLLQLFKFQKDKTSMECKEEACSLVQNEISNDDHSSNVDESEKSKKDQKEDFLDSLYDQNDSKSVDEESTNYTEPADQEFLMDSQQRILEDELLDEEICKITENMSHDEYVLTDQVSPVPESTSTPINIETKKTEDVGKKRKHERKKEKAKKKNLSDEQVTLDSSGAGSPADTSMMYIPDSGACAVERGADGSTTEEFEFHEECSKDAGEDLAKLKKNKDSEQEIRELNSDTKAENFSIARVLNNEDTSKESHLNERLSLKLTINKRTIENSKEQDILTKKNEKKTEKLLDTFDDPIKDIDKLESDIDQFNLDMYFGSSKKVGSRRNTESIEELDSLKVGNLDKDVVDQQDSVFAEEEKQNECMKETRHGRSKKGKGKKHQEENIVSKLKDNQSKQMSETGNSQKSTDSSKTLEYNDENPELLLYDSQLESKCVKVNNVIGRPKIDGEDEHGSDELKITVDQDARSPRHDDVELKQATEEQTDPGNKNNSFDSVDDEEASSSSSLADKPLSQLLLRTNVDSDDELRPEEKKVEKDPDTNIPADDQQCTDKEATNSERMEPQITSEEECESEMPKTVTEDSDKDTKVSLESEINEPITSLKDVEDKDSDNTNEIETANNDQNSSVDDRQGSNEIVSKSHKYSSKEGHRRFKGQKAPARSRIADLTSGSEDSEVEDEIELRNKSMIVKSVFGRVFGGEKADKVKEVLNDWVSKSEDDSDLSRSEFRSASPTEADAEEASEVKDEDKNTKRHSFASSVSSGGKKKSGRKSKEGCSSDRTKQKNPVAENKHAKSKNISSIRKKSGEDASDCYFLDLPPNKSRHSKKIAEERISRAFDGVRMFEEFLGGEQKEANYGLRSQSKPDLTIKDSGYGSFNYDEDSSKMVCSEEPLEEDQSRLKTRKSSSSRICKSRTESEDWKDLVMEMRSLKNTKEPIDEEDNSIKDLPEQEPLASTLSTDLKSPRSCSSLAPSSVRNRSPSMDRNSQSTRDSDVDEEDDDVGHGRISPLFVRETPGSSIESSSNSENEEEDENVIADETATRNRSSSEFSGEKIVIRSPSSVHKGEVVTIAPTDAIEDNALDVPQEIETAKPRQGKVLNFDEELFVECCSRLKATTENELRGAKKIKLDHNEGYHRKDDQQQGLKGPRDRWRDVESQNSLGSLLESVNQLLGEEMYSTRERDFPKRGGRNLRSEHSSRSASPDVSRSDNLGYEDSLDVAFEHNNKLRDKIQQRMRESENLIASTFGKSNNDTDGHRRKTDEQDPRNSYSHLQDQGHVSGANLSNRSYADALHIRNLQEQQNAAKMNLDSGFKNKMNSSLGGLLDKALSNLLHSNGKHDHNGSTPMKVLAELACARAPTSTNEVPTTQEMVQPAKTLPNKESISDPCPLTVTKDVQKKPRNPIKELFERKKEMNERKQQEKSKTEAALRELNVHRQRKTKKIKKHQDFPLIRRSEEGGGLVERKKRRDGFERKEEFVSDRIKDVYDFDEEESQIEPNLGNVLSYRSRPGYEVSCLRTKDVDVAGLMSKAIGDSLENGKAGDALSSRLESMIDRKFKELEKFAPKTKGALKSFQGEDQRQVTGPMDEFVERKQLKPKRPVEQQSLKHSKLKKRNKNPKKKTRNAWYENDSSDEYRTTAVKAEDIGVGISKSQRTCSKGKQNIFAELYTSSESEFEHEGVNYESKRQRRVKKNAKKMTESENLKQTQEPVNSKYSSENEDQADDWRDQDLKNDAAKQESDHKKSESEMSDHPLVIDERKDADDQRNSDDETENQYERNYEMDDLYREDSSVVDSDVEDSMNTEAQSVSVESRVKSSILTNGKTNSIRENELIPLEEALDLLDQANNETPLTKYSNADRSVKPSEHIDHQVITTEPDANETFDFVEEPAAMSPGPEEQEEEPDNDLLSLPEKLSSNEKPQKESDNLPLHVFLSRKVQESKKRKEQQLKKIQEEQERILMDFQPTRRQRKCAIGKQGLLAEISSSDEEISPRDKRCSDKFDHDKPRKQKRESKEKRKERYIEKKHEQMIAKEQKAIEEEILRELGKRKDSQNTQSSRTDLSDAQQDSESPESVDSKDDQEAAQRKKHQTKEKQRKSSKIDEEIHAKDGSDDPDDLEDNCNKAIPAESNHEEENNQESSAKQKKHSKSPTKPKKTSKGDTKATFTSKRSKSSNSDKSKNRTDSKGSKDKERRSSNGKHDSDDEELKTTKSWNKVEEGVGVAIGRRKRAAANQLYYWSSSSDEEEMLEMVPVVEEEEDDRQEQHGWIVGDSHKRMITMLAMEKQLKEKRRRSEDEFEPGRAKSKKHRNSTS